jgi:hypothetical protein
VETRIATEKLIRVAFKDSRWVGWGDGEMGRWGDGGKRKFLISPMGEIPAISLKGFSHFAEASLANSTVR